MSKRKRNIGLEIRDGLRELKRGDYGDDEKIEKALTRAVRRAAEQHFGKRPLVDVTIHRV